jgi:hypothetical protein
VLVGDVLLVRNAKRWRRSGCRGDARAVLGRRSRFHMLEKIAAAAGIEAALESYRQGRVADAKRAREIIDAALGR